MRVQVVDPPAYTPPYDRALCAALAGAGAEVELVTTRFPYGPVPPARGYEVTELFYRRAARREAADPRRRALRAAEHVPDMLRCRAHAEAADLVHLQWLSAPGLDRHLLPRRPRILTVHDPLPEGGRSRRAWVSLMRRMDALVVHSAQGADALAAAGIDRGRIRRIPHGVFAHLTEQAETVALPPELAEVEGQVILCFGLVRPYKGVDVLIEAFSRIEGAELWIVGMPRMDMGPLEEAARGCRGTVRFVSRFITDPEIPAYFRRADVVVLPYRRIEQSGVLYTALAFEKPVVASAVGGFAEVGADGTLALVPPGDPAALAGELGRLVAEPRARAELAARAAAAAGGEHSWTSIAERTLALYREVLGGEAAKPAAARTGAAR